MATDTVMNRTYVPIEILYNVNGADFPIAQWIINPDLSILDTVPIDYCKIVGDLLVEMTAAEKAAVDAAKLEETKRTTIASICAALEEYIEKGTGAEYPENSGNYIPTTAATLPRWLYWKEIGSKWVSLGLSFPFVACAKDGSVAATITRDQDFSAIVDSIGVYLANLTSAAQKVVMAIHAANTPAEVTAAASAYLANAPR